VVGSFDLRMRHEPGVRSRGVRRVLRKPGGLLSRDLPSTARNILSSLQNQTEAAIEELRELSC
jgi:hypothetical protein